MKKTNTESIKDIKENFTRYKKEVNILKDILDQLVKDIKRAKKHIDLGEGLEAWMVLDDSLKNFEDK